MLKTKQLLHVYMFILSLGAIFLSHCLNDGFVQYIANNIASLNGSKIESLWTLVLFGTNGLENIGTLMDEAVLHNFYYNVAIQMGLAVFFLKVHLGKLEIFLKVILVSFLKVHLLMYLGEFMS